MARSFRGLVILALVASYTPAVRATPLAPGQTVLGSTAGNTLASYTGSVVSVSQFSDSLFSISGPGGPTVGFISSAVVQTSSPGLDFVYQVNVSVGSVTSLSVPSFNNLQTNVSQTADHTALASTNQFFPGTVPVFSYTRSSGDGATIDVAFSGSGVTTEEASNLIIIHTNSEPSKPPFDMTAPVIINGVEIPLLQAVVPLPEPTTLVLWGGTFSCMVCFITWRQRRVLAKSA
jgi:hypothetical protein